MEGEVALVWLPYPQTLVVVQDCTCRQTPGLCLCGFPMHVGKYPTEMPSHFFIPFVFPFESFQPHCLCSSSDREVSLHDIRYGFEGMATVGICRGMLQVLHGEKTGADIQVSCSTDTVLFSPLSFYFFLCWSLCMDKIIRHHTTCVVYSLVKCPHKIPYLST